MLWIIDYHLLRFYLENKILFYHGAPEQPEWIMCYANLNFLFPSKDHKDDSVNLWNQKINKQKINQIIKDFTMDCLEVLKNHTEKNSTEYEKFLKIIEKFPITGGDINNVMAQNFSLTTYITYYTPKKNPFKKEEYDFYKWKMFEIMEGEENLYEEKKEVPDDSTRQEYFDNLKIKRLAGGNINNLIEPSTIDKNNTELNEFVINVNDRFRELNEEFCINCDREQQLKKLNELFKVNNMDETELYEKYDISIRDLNLYIYLNLLEYIQNSSLKDKYKIIFLNSIETVIIEHILYSIWFFMFSDSYVFDEFKNKINNGHFKIETIIRYIRHKEKIKFSKINKNILEKYYKNILTKFVYNIKVNRDYYNNNKINKNNSIESLLIKYKNNKYDNKYFINRQKELKVYNNLISIVNIKDNINIDATYNKKIVNLLNIVIKVILFYRNLYIYINDICKFFSINNSRNYNEVKYNINNFSSYLNVKEFMKKHFIKNKRLVIDNEIIICKSIKDFNKYINKLLSKLNKLNLEFLKETWDLIELKLRLLNIFTDFEIECIKLIICNDYNSTLLKKGNKFIHNYTIHKKLFKKNLNILKVDYTNITKYNYNIKNLDTKFTGIEFKNLINMDNCLGYFK